MKRALKIMLISSSIALVGCLSENKKTDFKYLNEEFADLKIIKYDIPGWNSLTLKQKAYAYHLAEAAKYGRDITWDQYCKYNLDVRHILEDILSKYDGDKDTEDYKQFLVYAKRVFFSNGIHHHYAEDKLIPAFSKDYFRALIKKYSSFFKEESKNEEMRDFFIDAILKMIYDENIYAQRRSTSKNDDIVKLSAVNFYDNVSREEVEKYYNKIIDLNDDTPIAYGLNTKLVKDENGKIVEKAWKLGGIYSKAIEKIIAELSLAKDCAENDIQKRALTLLIEYYKTGDLKKWDEFNIEWVKDTLGQVDFINGFIEDYDDPLGRKATWEGYVHIKDSAASARTEMLSKNAQWFEDNSPVLSKFKKEKVKGISAKVVNAVALAGACYPATPIGINLPNADWIRRDHGSKSVTIANITHAYAKAAAESPNSTLKEFTYSEQEVEDYKKYGEYVNEVHTDLHECLGHASGQLLKGVASTALGEYQSALEEARADLFGLYYVADPKMVELGIIPDMEAYKSQYANYIRNGLMVQFSRVELGKKNTEAHMQNRLLIAAWCYEKGAKNNVIEKKVKDGKTYFVVNDYVALRALFAELLAEIQRIKSEGDYQAGKNLVETYAVNIDPDIHKEVKERYEKLNLRPYGGFINPEIVPISKDGEVVDYQIQYVDNYLEQMLHYGKKYSTL